MTLKTGLLFFAGLAIAGTAHAQLLSPTTATNPFRPERYEFAKVVQNVTQPAPATHEVRLAIITVSRDVDRARQLQLTLGGNPVPALTLFPTELRGQALVTVHLRVGTTFAP
jgi:hypothetical protein